MVRVDGHLVSGFRLNEPRKLHDRAASRVEDRLLNGLAPSLHAVALSRHERDLSRGTRGGPARAHQSHVYPPRDSRQSNDRTRRRLGDRPCDGPYALGARR